MSEKVILTRKELEQVMGMSGNFTRHTNGEFTLHVMYLQSVTASVKRYGFILWVRSGRGLTWRRCWLTRANESEKQS